MTSTTITPKADTGLKSFLIDLFAVLDRERICYCVLRNYEDMPDSIGNDIDILIRPRQDAEFRACLLRSAEANDWLLLKELSRFGYHTYSLIDQGFRMFVQIDIFLGLSLKGIYWTDCEIILENRKRYKQFFVPSPAAEAGTLLLKDLLQTGSIKERYTTQILELARLYSQPLEDFLAWSVGKKLAAWLCRMASDGRWDMINNKRGKIVLAVIKRSFQRNPFITVINFGRFILGHLRARITCRAGLFVVLIGPDGSGKSTVAEGLRKSLAGLFKHRRYYHGHFGILPQLKIFRNFALRVLGKTAPEPPADGMPEAHNPPKNGLLRALMYLLYYGLDYFLGHWIINKTRAYGDMIVFDRYFYDYFLQPHFDSVPRFLLPALKLLLPKPDVIIYLYNSPEVVLKRKAELTCGQIKEQQQRCAELIQGMSCAITVSTDAPVQEVIEEISHLIVTVMADRFGNGAVHISESDACGSCEAEL